MSAVRGNGSAANGTMLASPSKCGLSLGPGGIPIIIAPCQEKPLDDVARRNWFS